MIMLTLEEKRKVKDVLSALNVNPNINLAYFLNAIDNSNNNINSIKMLLNTIEYNQRLLDQKLDRIINLIAGHQ